MNASYYEIINNIKMNTESCWYDKNVMQYYVQTLSIFSSFQWFHTVYDRIHCDNESILIN